VFLTDIGSRPYEVSNAVSNNDVSGTSCPIDFMFDCRWLLSAASKPHRPPACINQFYLNQAA